jgi:SAM-dependent methyltransferase
MINVMKPKQDIQAEQEFFAGPMENFEPFDWRAKELLYFWLSRRNRPATDSLILDLAAGSGNFTKVLLARGHRVVGFDIAHNLIRTLRERTGLRQVFVGRAEEIALDSDSFDLVTMCGVLHHFPDILPLLEEIARVLKPGGSFFAIEPNLHNPWMFLFRSPSSPLYIPEGVTRNERPLSRRELDTALARVFPRRLVEGICGVTFLKSGTVLDPLLSGFNLYSRLMGKLLPRSRWGEFLICSGWKGSQPTIADRI